MRRLTVVLHSSGECGYVNGLTVLDPKSQPREFALFGLNDHGRSQR